MNSEKKFLIKVLILCYKFLNQKISLNEFHYGIEGEFVSYENELQKNTRSFISNFVGELEIDRHMYDFNDESKEVEKRAKNLTSSLKEILAINDGINLVNQIKNKLLLLLANVISRKEVADWATGKLLKNENISELERNYLLKLAAVDLINIVNQSYVDNEKTIIQWLIEFE